MKGQGIAEGENRKGNLLRGKGKIEKKRRGRKQGGKNLGRGKKLRLRKGGETGSRN